jgi:hypothetical protein
MPEPESCAPVACACLRGAVTVIVAAGNLWIEATTAVSEAAPLSMAMV